MGEFAGALSPEQSARLDAVERRRCAPLRIAVTGHPGSGRATLSAALRKCFGVEAARGCGRQRPGTGTPDLAVHVLGAGVRGCDRAYLDALRIPAVVVSGKADLRGGRVAARAVADVAQRELGRRVWSVSGLLGAVGDQLSGELWNALGRWADTRVTVPVLAAAFAEVDDPAERRLRTVALRTLGAAGLRTALEYRSANPDSAAAGLVRLFVTRSDVPLLADPIRRCGPAIAAERERRRRREITVLAARGESRDRIEAGLIR